MHPDVLEEELGRNLRSQRVAQRLRQVDLADLANVSVGAIKNLESGAGSTVSTLMKVLRALGREEWVDGLATAPAPFDPLALLEEREGKASTPPGTRRVRLRAGEGGGSA